MTVGVVFGGKSGEHEVSLNSAFHVIEAIDKEKYDVIMIAITKEGQWCQYSGEVANVRNNTWWQDEKNVNWDVGYMQPDGVMEKIDIFFPVLHGPNGEDGTIQGFLLYSINLMWGAAFLLPPWEWIKLPLKCFLKKQASPLCLI